MAPLNIFLSYISREAVLADLLEECIVRDFLGFAHVFAYSDQTSIPAGSKWLAEVTDALKKADLHIVLASPDSLEQKWINFEAGAAHVRGIPIIPLCHSGLAPAQLPVPLSESEGLALSADGQFERFYQAVATKLGSSLPPANFAAYAEKVTSFEASYEKKRKVAATAGKLTSSVEVVHNPKALCISSKQFLELGFENQLQKVIDAFPSSVPHTRVVNSKEARAALVSDKFSIVHIAAFVCPRSGDLYFSDVDLHSGKTLCDPANGDTIPVADFVDLLRGSETKLTVVTSCNSLVLATELLHVCHVVTAREMISPNQMATWVEEFYRRLPKESLSSALNEAIRMSGAKMAVYARQPAMPDLRVERSDLVAAGV